MGWGRVLELSSDRCRKSGRRASANVASLSTDLTATMNAVVTRCAPKITMARVRLRVPTIGRERQRGRAIFGPKPFRVAMLSHKPKT